MVIPVWTLLKCIKWQLKSQVRGLLDNSIWRSQFLELHVWILLGASSWLHRVASKTFHAGFSHFWGATLESSWNFPVWWQASSNMQRSNSSYAELIGKKRLWSILRVVFYLILATEPLWDSRLAPGRLVPKGDQTHATGEKHIEAY